jgi:sulfate adenylyltransferase subunit 1
MQEQDLVGFEKSIFEKIKNDYESIPDKLDVQDILFVPISALKGDNVVERSKNMDWYEGPTLMYILENIHIANDRNYSDQRFPVQMVIRPQSQQYHDFRGYAGRVAGGVFKTGDKVIALPSGRVTKIKSIEDMKGNMDTCFPPQSVVITLDDEIDISRGDMIVAHDNQPTISQDITMMFCWLNEKPLSSSAKYVIRHTTNEAKCIIKAVDFKIDVNTLEKNHSGKTVGLNEIGQLTLRTTKPVIFDSYKQNRVTGSVVLIDEGTNETVCAGMIV